MSTYICMVFLGDFFFVVGVANAIVKDLNGLLFFERMLDYMKISETFSWVTNNRVTEIFSH